MSPCHYCARLDALPNVPDHGICPVCHFAVCAHPSGRANGYFHAEQCSCGCRKLICEFDINEHAVKVHGQSGPEPCFPALTGTTALQAAGGAAAALGDAGGAGDPGDEGDAGSADDPGHPITEAVAADLNRFLNVVRPGAGPLVDALGRSWRGPEGRVVEVPGRPDVHRVEFASGFLARPDTLRRVGTLAVATLRRVFSRGDLPPALTRDESAARALRTWARGGPPPGPRVLATVPSIRDAPRAPSGPVVRALFAEHDAPGDGPRAAAWLLQDVLEAEADG